MACASRVFFEMKDTVMHYERIDVEESRRQSVRARYWVTPPAVITFLAVLVSIILLILLLTRAPDVETTRTVTSDNGTVAVACNNALVPNATACDQTTDCLQGFSNLAGDACVYYPRPADTVNCSSACYASDLGGATHCDGAGACVGDAASCVGACAENLECSALFEFNTALLSTYDPVSFWTWGSWYNPFGCLLGRCVALVLDIFAGSSANALFTNNVTYAWTPLGALTECKEYLDAEFRATYADCLTIERYLLDPSVIRTYSLFSGYANSSYPFQMSVCLYSFTCAPLSEATLASASVPAPAPAPAAFQTPDQWGFHAASGTADAPMGPTLNVRSPQLRSAAWSRIRDVIATVPGGYFDAYLAQSNLVPVPVPAPSPTSGV